MLRLKGEPFEILTVSVDDELEEASDAVKQRKIPGIHTWHAAGWGHPAALKFNVQNIPTWYLIDRQGVIRAKNPFGKELIPAVQAALTPLKKASRP